MIKGRIVNLKRVRLNDLTYILKWWQNQDLMRYYDRLPIHSPLELGEELRRNLSTFNRFDFIIETKVGEPIGLIYLQKISYNDRHCEIHIMIGESDKNTQLAGVEAGFLLLYYAFNQLNIHKVYGHVMEFASGAERLMKAVDFKEEAILKKTIYQKGRFWDVRIYGLLNTEFAVFLNTPAGKRYLAAFQSDPKSRI